jgi:hypothetical protein
MTRLVDIAEVVQGLAVRIEDLAREIFPAGVKDGHEWRIGSLAGEPGQSLGVHLSGARAGVWCDFSTGETGDALDLVAYALFGGDKKQAFAWSKTWLGLGGDAPAARSREMGPRKRAPGRRVGVAAADRRDEEETKKSRDRALAIWLSAQERLAGTPAAAYLRKRGLNLAALTGKDGAPRQPRSLRFAPHLYEPSTKRELPALVAGIVDHTGAMVAVHRTWLAEFHDGWHKAAVPNPKMTLGRYRGGAIRIWRGAGYRRLADEKPGATLTLTEGIEDALTIAIECPERRVWAAVSLANMGSLMLPACIGTVTICADNDAENSRAALGLTRAIDHFLRLGREVEIARPPAGVKDVNELLMRQGKAG